MGGQHHALATLPLAMTRYHCTIDSVTLGNGIGGKEYVTPPRFDQPSLLKGSLYRLLHSCNTIKHNPITFTYTHNHTFSPTNNSLFEKNVRKEEFISFSCSANSKGLQNNAIKINVQNKGKMTLSLSNMQRLTADGGDKRVLIYKLCPVHISRVRRMRKIHCVCVFVCVCVCMYVCVCVYVCLCVCFAIRTWGYSVGFHLIWCRKSPLSNTQ